MEWIFHKKPFLPFCVLFILRIIRPMRASRRWGWAPSHRVGFKPNYLPWSDWYFSSDSKWAEHQNPRTLVAILLQWRIGTVSTAISSPYSTRPWTYDAWYQQISVFAEFCQVGGTLHRSRYNYTFLTLSKTVCQTHTCPVIFAIIIIQSSLHQIFLFNHQWPWGQFLPSKCSTSFCYFTSLSFPYFGDES